MNESKSKRGELATENKNENGSYKKLEINKAKN